MKESQQKQNKETTNCKICKKAFNYTPHYEYPKGWFIPVCCSDKCKEQYRKQELKNRMNTLVNKAGIPDKYRNLQTDKAKLLAEIIDNKKSIYAWGSAGTGKTVFACSVIKEMLWKYETYDIRFISSARLIMELQNSYRKEGESAFEYLDEIADKNVLILDDLGAEKMTDFVRQALYYLINEREQWQLQTIITSNFSLTQLDEYIDSRISSRIAGMCKIVEFTGQDRRLMK